MCRLIFFLNLSLYRLERERNEYFRCEDDVPLSSSSRSVVLNSAQWLNQQVSVTLIFFNYGAADLCDLPLRPGGSVKGIFPDAFCNEGLEVPFCNEGLEVPFRHGPLHTPSSAFRHLPPNSARFSYATEGALFISAQLCNDAVSALRS